MAMIRIPMVDFSSEIQPIRDRLEQVMREVLVSGKYISGPNVSALEEEAAAFLGVRRAVSLNSGSDALVIGLRALGIGAGDEVITSPFSFVATAEAIRRVGAEPVFVDILPDTFNLDPMAVQEKFTSRTKGVIPVHLFGGPANMDVLMEIAGQNGASVLEDAAQAFGAKYEGRKVGAIGDAGAFSFFPTKPLGAFGDGGLLVTNDDAVADIAIRLARHGARVKGFSEEVGYNSRLDELQAALLRVKLPDVERANEARRRVAGWYFDHLGRMEPNVVVPRPEHPGHVYHQYTIRVRKGRREAVRAALTAAGIASAIYYSHLISDMPPYRRTDQVCREAELASREVLSLPIHPSLSREAVAEVCGVIKAVVGR